MTLTFRATLAVLLVVLSSWPGSAQIGPPAALAPVLAPVLAPTGTLRASFLATNPVQGRLDPRTGVVAGPVGDLVPELARRLGVPYRILPVPDAAALIESVRSGQADIGFLAVEAARATQVDFSAPFALMGNAYLVRAESPIRQSADVDRTGIVVGAVTGQSQQVWVSEHVRNARLHAVPTVPPADALAGMLIRGEVDAFAANRQRMEDVARTDARLRVLSDNFSVIPQALVVRKGDSARLVQVNRFIDAVLASGFVQSSLDRAQLAGVEVAGVEVAGSTPPR